MRSGTEVREPRRRGRGAAALAAGVLLALAGCGDWSNEDLRFYAALPTRAELHVAVPSAPAVAAAGGQGPLLATAACGPLGDAEAWLWAKPTSDKLNASVDWVLGLVDVVRRYPPTKRLEDGRIWGPFDDDQHPGNEMQIVILRTWPGGREAPPLHAYFFEARRKAGAGAFTPIISGHFAGASASAGTGGLTLAFDVIRALGMGDADSPTGALVIAYDRAVEPRTVGLSLVQSGGFGLERFDYGFEGWADGRGRLRYAFRSGPALVTVRTGFDASGAGRGLSTLHLDGGFSGQYAQCWDAAACLVWVDDPNDYSCGRAGCSGGAESACPAVPAP